MKKIISILTLAVIMFTMCTVNVFAAGVYTLTSSADSAVAGEEVILSVTLDTTNGTKAIGFKITFDPNDFELGTSEASDAAALEYADFIGTPDFPTLDDVTLATLGRASYVDDTYADTYATYASTKNLGTATIGYEEKDGKGKVGFGYAITTAKNALNKLDNMSVGGAVLKVKTTAKKEATITITESMYQNGSNEKFDGTSNEVKIALNGYTGEEEEEVFGIEETSKALAGGEMMIDATGEKVAAAGDKVVAIFAKAKTDLAAESYGIIFGGKRYPGILPVSAGQAWAVKLVGSAEQLPTGSSYEYGIFAEGCDDVMSATPWVVE